MHTSKKSGKGGMVKPKVKASGETIKVAREFGQYGFHKNKGTKQAVKSPDPKRLSDWFSDSCGKARLFLINERQRFNTLVDSTSTPFLYCRCDK
jgi:hypothetical protein